MNQQPSEQGVSGVGPPGAAPGGMGVRTASGGGGARDRTQEHFAERFYTHQQAERYRDRFRKGRRARTDRMEKAILRQLMERTGRIAAALDLACGTGRLSGVLGEFAEQVILADRSLAMLEVAKEELVDPRFKAQQVDAEHISMADGSVDLVFCHRFLHHVFSTPRRARILGEIARVTRRYVILSYYPAGLLNRWRAAKGRWLGRSVPDAFQPSLGQYCDGIQAAGLRIVHSVTMRCFPVTGTFFLLQREDVADRAAEPAPAGGRPQGPKGSQPEA